MRGFKRTVLFILCFMVVWCMAAPNYIALAAEAEVIWLDKEYELGYEDVLDFRDDFADIDTGLGKPAFSEGLAVVSMEGPSGRKFGFIDKNGNEVVPLKYDVAHSFKEGMAIVKLNEKWGFIDKNGKEVIPPKYDYVYSFNEGLARVKVGDKWGYVDKKGDMVIPPKYEVASDFSEGLAAVREYKGSGEWNYIDKSGNVVLSNQYDWSGNFSNGMAVVYNYEDTGLGYEIEKYGIIDKTGKEIVPIKYDFIHSFSEGLARVELNDKYGVIDTKGNLVVPLKYDYIAPFREDMAMVRLNYKWGFIDKNGNEVIPIRYGDARSFNEGLAIVALGLKYGYIDKTGREVIPIKYEYLCSSFNEGLAAVMFYVESEDEYNFGYIDKEGNIVIPPRYWPGYHFKDGVTVVEKDGKIGIIKNPIAPETQELEEFVTRLYELTLSRKPDQKGLDYWINELFYERKTGADVSENFIFSKEFIEKNISNSDFINIMYRAFFDREPDEGGKRYWLDKLEQGFSRRYVLAGFVNSKEFNELCNVYGIIPGSIKLTPEDTKSN